MEPFLLLCLIDRDELMCSKILHNLSDIFETVAVNDVWEDCSELNDEREDRPMDNRSEPILSESVARDFLEEYESIDVLLRPFSSTRNRTERERERERSEAPFQSMM